MEVGGSGQAGSLPVGDKRERETRKNNRCRESLECKVYDDKAKTDKNQMKMKYSRRLRWRRKKKRGGGMELRKRKKRRSAVGWVDVVEGPASDTSTVQ